MPSTRRQLTPDKYPAIKWSCASRKRRGGTRANPMLPPTREHDYIIVETQNSRSPLVKQPTQYLAEELQAKFSDCPSAADLASNKEIVLTNEHVAQLFTNSRGSVGQRNRALCSQTDVFKFVEHLLLQRNARPATFNQRNFLRKVVQLRKCKAPLSGPDLFKFNALPFVADLKHVPMVERTCQETRRPTTSKTLDADPECSTSGLRESSVFVDYKALNEGKEARTELEEPDIDVVSHCYHHESDNERLKIEFMKLKYKKQLKTAKKNRSLYDCDVLKTRLHSEKRASRSLRIRLRQAEQQCEKYKKYSTDLEKYTKQLRSQVTQLYRAKVRAEVERDSYVLDLEQNQETITISKDAQPPTLQPQISYDQDLDSELIVVESEDSEISVFNEIEVNTTEMEAPELLIDSLEPVGYGYMRPEDITLG